MEELRDRLLLDPNIWQDPCARELVHVMCGETGMTASGHAYLERPAYERLRDWIPHILDAGPRVLQALERIQNKASELDIHTKNAPFALSGGVVRQVVFTAAVTAPPDLWLLRHVLSTFVREGFAGRLLNDQTLSLDEGGYDPRELAVDCNFLLSRGLLVQQGNDFRMSNHASSRALWRAAKELPKSVPADQLSIWAALFSGSEVSATEMEGICARSNWYTSFQGHSPPAWYPTPWDVEWGYRLVPLVLGMQMAGRLGECLQAGRVSGVDLACGNADVGEWVEEILRSSGVIDRDCALSVPGRRVLERGPGPFGIIAAYSAYMDNLSTILREGRSVIHVERRNNVLASQHANRRTFQKANDSLDRYCLDTGYEIRVFIEHALGRGEATRQRYERSGSENIQYVGADLEDAAIAAAREEYKAGRLPENMVFLSGMDIGDPDGLVHKLRTQGISTEGAVMVVGNGFHEVRRQTDKHLVDVFSRYEQAGILLLFTEESALATDDLLQTAWNTYHAGFRYVHERSGQGLRPASPVPPSRYSGGIRASWEECAQRGGYVRLEKYCGRSRRIYPYATVNGHNPSISVNHFFVPRRLADRTS